jgi:hypothetical protein
VTFDPIAISAARVCLGVSKMADSESSNFTDSDVVSFRLSSTVFALLTIAFQKGKLRYRA